MDLAKSFPKIAQYQQQVTTALESFSLPNNPANLYEPIQYFLSIGGKRLRPALLLASSALFSDNYQRALSAAIGVELFHNFTLLHDDIMDNAPIRRNMQTVHEKYNTNIAILAGDALFVKSCQMVANVPITVLEPVLNAFWKAALEVCEGQQMDMDFENQNNVSLEQYIRMISLKTAVLLAASLEMGALIGGAVPADAKKLYEFGLHIGIAFQLQDDLLDVYGKPEKFGKRQGGDIVSNKKTCLQLAAIASASGNVANRLKQLFDPNYQISPYDKVAEVTNLYNTLGVKEVATELMNKYLHNGLSALNSVEANPEIKLELTNFAKFLIEREF